MRSRTAERIDEREVPDQPKSLVARAGDRPQLEREWIFLGGSPHVVELDIAAELHRPVERLRDSEMNLRARASVLVIAVGELRGVEILPYLEPADDSVSALDRLVYLVNVGLAFRQLPSRRGRRVRM